VRVTADRLRVLEGTARSLVRCHLACLDSAIGTDELVEHL